MPPKEGQKPEFGGYIVWHKWYCGLTSSVKFWSLCDKYCGRGGDGAAQISPLSGGFAATMGGHGALWWTIWVPLLLQWT